MLPLVGIIFSRPTGGPTPIVPARPVYAPRSGRPTCSGPVRQDPILHTPLNQPGRPCVLPNMGVLHMALPVSVKARPSSHRFAPRRVPRSIPHAEAAPKALQQINPVPAQRDTLPLPAKPLPLEAKLERTPDQEAANEALVKLVRQCMAGDSQSWQQLVVSQHRRIYAICYRFTGSGNDAEDLTQEVFLKLYKNLASFDTQKGSFQTWITTLARNLLVDHFRRTRTEGPGPERAQTALPRTPRSSYTSRSRRYGLQRDITGSPDPRRNGQKPHQSRTGGTCKAFATYRKSGE